MKKEIVGLLMVAISAVLFSLMSLFVKLCDLSSWEVFFIRGIFQALISWLVAVKKGVGVIGHKSARPLLCLNGLFGSLRIGFFFYAVKNGHLGDVTAIFFTAPSIVVVLGSILFKDPIRLTTAASVLLCLSGTALITKPQFLFGPDNSHSKDDEATALTVSIAGAISSAAFYMTIPYVNRQANDQTIIFYFGIIATLISIVPFLLSEPRWPDEFSWIWIVMVVVCGYLGQLFLNNGLKIANRSSVLVRNIDVALAFVYAYFIFHRDVTMTSLGGAALIVCAGVILVVENIMQQEVVVDLETYGHEKDYIIDIKSSSSEEQEPLLSKN